MTQISKCSCLQGKAVPVATPTHAPRVRILSPAFSSTPSGPFLCSPDGQQAVPSGGETRGALWQAVFEAFPELIGWDLFFFFLKGPSLNVGKVARLPEKLRHGLGLSALIRFPHLLRGPGRRILHPRALVSHSEVLNKGHVLHLAEWD